MKKIRCLAIDDEPIALDKLESYIKKVPYLELAGRCESPLDAISIVEKGGIDALFMDINMPDINGMDLLASLPNAPLAVFTTAYSDYAVESYKLNAVDYLLKPYDFSDFCRAANKLLQRISGPAAGSQQEESATGNLLVKEGYKFVNVSVNDILYIKGYSEYVQVFVDGRESPIIASTSIKNIKMKLPSNFIQVHRSFVVNMNRTVELEKLRINMSNGVSIPIGENYKQAVTDYIRAHSIEKQ